MVWYAMIDTCVVLRYITLHYRYHVTIDTCAMLRYLIYVTLCYVMLRYVALSSPDSAALSKPRHTERGHREYTQSLLRAKVDPRLTQGRTKLKRK